MSTKTCIQAVYVAGKGIVDRRRPHVTDGPTASGYAECSECGATVYVGQGEMSPMASQLREHRAVLADRRGWA